MNDQNITIVRLDEKVEGSKRFYAPVGLEWDCRNCGKHCKRSYHGQYYFMYPHIPGPQEVHLYCEHCDHESGPYMMQLDITLEMLEEEVSDLDKRIAQAEARWKEKVPDVPSDVALGEGIKALRSEVEALMHAESSSSAAITKARVDRSVYLEKCIEVLGGMMGQLIT